MWADILEQEIFSRHFGGGSGFVVIVIKVVDDFYPLLQCCSSSCCGSEPDVRVRQKNLLEYDGLELKVGIACLHDCFGAVGGWSQVIQIHPFRRWHCRGVGGCFRDEAVDEVDEVDEVDS